MKKELLAGFTAGLFLFIVIGAANANLIENGDFESGLTNWTTRSFNGGLVSLESEGGNTFVRQTHTDDNDWTSIGQENLSDLVLGQNYLFTFDYSITDYFTISMSYSDPTIVMHSTPINRAYQIANPIIADGLWQTYSLPYEVTADFFTAGEPMISLRLDYNRPTTLDLDNISVVKQTAVPEPATMLLFGTGLVGLVGSRMRKKKK